MNETSPQWLKPTTEYGPLAAFFIAYLLSDQDLMAATAVLLVATGLALALSLAIARRVPMLPLVTAVIVGVFGGLTLWLKDPTFIKMKPTIVQALFSVVLLGGLAFGRPLLSTLLGAAWPMDQEGWRRLTLRFAIFFAAMPALNEAVWRTQTEEVWVFFKVFGIMILTIIFAVAQTPLMKRHHVPEDGQAGD